MLSYDFFKNDVLKISVITLPSTFLGTDKFNTNEKVGKTSIMLMSLTRPFFIKFDPFATNIPSCL